MTYCSGWHALAHRALGEHGTAGEGQAADSGGRTSQPDP